MKIRVYSRDGRFWIQWYDKGQHRKPLNLPVDIPVPEKIKDNQNWWKKSKHREQIQEELHAVTLRSLYGPDYVPVERIEVPDIDAFLEEFNARDKQLSHEKKPSTYRHRQNAISFLKQYATKRIDKLTEDFAIDVKEKALADEYSPATIRGYIVELRQLWEFAIKRGYARENIWKKIRVKVVTRPKEPTDPDVERDILHRMYWWNRKLFDQVFAQRLSGFRGDDVARIKSVKEFREYFNNKVSRYEKLPTSEALDYHLARVTPAGEYLFHFRDPVTVNNYMVRLAEYLGYPPMYLHGMKRNYVAEIDHEDVPDRHIVLLAHHSPIGATSTVLNSYSRNRQALKRILDKYQAHWIDDLLFFESNPVERPKGFIFSNPRSNKSRDSAGTIKKPLRKSG